MREKFKQRMLVRNYRIGRNREVGAADLDCAPHVCGRKATAQWGKEGRLKPQEAENWGETH